MTGVAHLQALLREEDLLDVVAIAVLLLKRDEACVQVVGVFAGDVVERVLVDGPRALRFLAKLLKLRKVHVQRLYVLLLLQHLQQSAPRVHGHRSDHSLGRRGSERGRLVSGCMAVTKKAASRGQVETVRGHATLVAAPGEQRPVDGGRGWLPGRPRPESVHEHRPQEADGATCIGRAPAHQHLLLWALELEAPMAGMGRLARGACAWGALSARQGCCCSGVGGALMPCDRDRASTVEEDCQGGAGRTGEGDGAAVCYRDVVWGQLWNRGNAALG